MRRVIAGVMMSLDGVMQAPGGPEEDPNGFKFGGWVWPHFDEAGGEEMDKWFSQPFDLLLGRRTYDIFAAYWPYQAPDNPIRVAFDKATKYVATSSKAALTWQNSIALHDAVREVARLKQQDGPALLTQGSTVLLHSLLSAGLVDEFRISMFPVVLGSGKKLFAEGSAPVGLKLTESLVTPSGVTMNTYVRDGEVKTGSLPDNPSAVELERRERMKKEG